MVEEPAKPAHLRLAVDNNADFAPALRDAAVEEIGHPLRVLAANVMRVSRGAGKPHEIASDCERVLDAFRTCHEKMGAWPSSYEIDQVLSIQNPLLDSNVCERLPEYYCQKLRLDDALLRGALQVAASRLLGQDLQIGAGERQMAKARHGLQRLKEERAAVANGQKQALVTETQSDDGYR